MFELDDYITKDSKLHKQLVHRTNIDNKIHKDKLKWVMKHLWK